MIIAGGEEVAVATGKCQWCGAPTATGKFAFKCSSCDRQRCRIQLRTADVDGVKNGVTTCCAWLPVEVRGRWCCPRCPGEGKVRVVLCHDGEETNAYYPLEASVRLHACTLEELAARRGVAVDELVIPVDDARDFQLRRLRSVSRRFMHREMRTKNFVCEVCEKEVVRKVTKRGFTRTKKCERCMKKPTSAGRASKIRYMERKREDHKAQCKGCGNKRVIRTLATGLCSACGPRQERNGLCDCGKAKVRPHGREPMCPSCTPAHRLHQSPTVEVTVTDGERERQVLISEYSLIGPGRITAGSLVAPVVLVHDVTVNRLGMRARGTALVSGIQVPFTGPLSRALLGALGRLPLPSFAACLETSKRELGCDYRDREGWAPFRQLRRAGLLDDSGLTARAHAVLAWCRAAGVKL